MREPKRALSLRGAVGNAPVGDVGAGMVTLGCGARGEGANVGSDCRDANRGAGLGSVESSPHQDKLLMREPKGAAGAGRTDAVVRQATINTVIDRTRFTWRTGPSLLSALSTLYGPPAFEVFNPGA